MRSGSRVASACSMVGSLPTTGSVSVRLVIAGGAPSRERDGVAIGRANKGLSRVIRYCGPTGKFVSWAELIPIMTNDRRNKLTRRISASGKRTPEHIMKKKRANSNRDLTHLERSRAEASG